MNWQVWSEIESTLEQRKLKPILAVVPDNQDPALKIDPPAENYWDRVRLWQSNGWEIALHGYQHRYVTRHAGMVTIRKKSEFAGIPVAEQEDKLRRGIEILEQHGVRPRVWVAPGNSFDTSTVSLLPRFGISMICDGHFRYPFLCRRNVFWVPQQLFRFRPAPPGVWTVCYHHNQWTTADLRMFRDDVDQYAAEISSLDEVAQEWAGRRSWWSGLSCTSPRISPLLIRGHLRLAGWWRAVAVRAQSPVKRVSTLQPR